MERASTIMERLGFKEDADDGVKAAFVKNLIKQAYGIDVPLPEAYQKPKSKSEKELQLSFDFEESSRVG